MVLHAAYRLVLVLHALHALVIDIGLGESEAFGNLAYREAVVLGRYECFFGFHIHHGMVGAAVAELQLIGVAPESMGEQLVAEADPEDRPVAFKLAEGLMGLREY